MTPPLTLPTLLETRAAQFGDKPLLRTATVARTYRETRDMAARTAGALRAAGVAPGDRVAALVSNRVELLDLMLGCAWLGATVAPLNTALRGASLRAVLERVRTGHLMVEAELVTVLPDDWPGTPWVLDDEPMRHLADADPLPPADVRPGDSAAILFTSGTTGGPKGVCCPHAQFYWWGRSVGSALEITADDVLYTCLPLFHTNALSAFVQALVAGAEFVLGQRFSASRFWHEVTASGATVTYLLGAMVPMLLAQPPGEHDRAHRAWRALAPASPAALCEPFRERFGVRLVDGFGSTETNLVIGTDTAHTRPGYLGRVLNGFTARVVDDDHPVPDGVPGELVLRHDNPYAFATGYWDQPEATARSWRNLWLHTGDRVVREPDGWYRFVDRIKDVIRRRGENISSFEVEHAVATHPAVAAVAAFAVASELAEDEVMIAVTPRAGHDLDLAELLAHCARDLPYFAVPRYVDVVAALPLTETGKIAKAELRRRGVTESAVDMRPPRTHPAGSRYPAPGRSAAVAPE
ncbi:AMP-binding protein [Nocardia alni]|uniref:AMP-binding protein n=1 Tax=Nocardia alni TaxID=2815723 RepID=UPI001C24492E|nr:AMP-binding protein [Nocardia alni]